MSISSRSIRCRNWERLEITVRRPGRDPQASCRGIAKGKSPPKGGDEFIGDAPPQTYRQGLSEREA